MPPSSDGVFFNVYEFTLAPNSQCDISITWKPVEYGNMRKLIKIKQVDSNRKYDFVILGNCNGPPHKKFKVNIIEYFTFQNKNIKTLNLYLIVKLFLFMLKLFIIR